MEDVKITSELFEEFQKEKELLNTQILNLQNDLKERDKIIKDFIKTPARTSEQKNIEELEEIEEQKKFNNDVKKVIDIMKRKRGIK